MLAQIRQALGDTTAAQDLFAKAAEAKKKLEAEQERKLGTMGHATREVPQGKAAHRRSAIADSRQWPGFTIAVAAGGLFKPTHKDNPKFNAVLLVLRRQ